MATILLVDDNEMLRTFAARNLEADLPGVRVATAGTCDEARRRAAADRPQVVILDQRLEDGLGTDLIRDLASELPETRIIMASGETGAVFRDRASSAGAVETLVKPYDLELLVAAVRRALETVGAVESGSSKERTPSDPGRASSRSQPDSKLRHRVLNRLSALLTGLRACEAEVVDGAADPDEVRRVVELYFPRLRDAVAEASSLLRQMEGEDGGSE